MAKPVIFLCLGAKDGCKWDKMSLCPLRASSSIQQMCLKCLARLSKVLGVCQWPLVKVRGTQNAQVHPQDLRLE